jgi:hypothetical protein
MHRRIAQVGDDAPDLIADGRPTRLTRHEDVVAQSAQVLGQLPGLRRLSPTIGTLEGDEESHEFLVE